MALGTFPYGLVVNLKGHTIRNIAHIVSITVYIRIFLMHYIHAWKIELNYFRHIY